MISYNILVAVDLSNTLVTGVSSRALFNLEEETFIFETQGLQAFKEYQLEHVNETLQPGAAFPLVKALLSLNENLAKDQPRPVEVIIASKNSPEVGLRMLNSIEEHNLDISRAILSGGSPLTPYLKAFKVNLFLTQDAEDAESAIKDGFPAAVLYDPPVNPLEQLDEIRIAFDGDAVIFADDSERIYQEQGIQAFTEHELANADTPMNEGPLTSFLRALANLQKNNDGGVPIRTALVTARGGSANKRVISTLNSWGIKIDEIFFMGGVAKGEILEAFRAQIFFDDHPGHCKDAVKYVPTGRVPSDLRKPANQ